MKSVYYTSSLSDKIEKLHNNAIPVKGKFVALNEDCHAMVIAGYYDITVKYKKSRSSSYSYITYRYYTVNDGWKHSTKGDRRIQYIRRKYLKKGIYEINKR